MSKKIPLDGIPDKIEEDLNRLIKAVIIDVDAHVKQKTPVDIGTLRRNWQIVEGGISSSAPPLRQKNYPTGGDPRFTNFSTPKWGRDYYLVNNLPYAPAIFTGKDLPKSWGGKNRSPLSPAWLPMIAKDTQRRIDVIAARIGRRS